MDEKKEIYLTKEVRRKGIVGLVESKGLVKSSIHFSEWWNGEGMDFVVDSDNKEPEVRISLHSEELTVMMAIAIKTGYVEIDEVNKLVEEIRDKDY